VPDPATGENAGMQTQSGLLQLLKRLAPATGNALFPRADFPAPRQASSQADGMIYGIVTWSRPVGEGRGGHAESQINDD
jgi:hypothetical protein